MEEILEEKLKMRQKSAKNNYFYNLIYQILLVITPLITTPYISRVLGSSEIGKYSFVASTVSVFIVISNLGFHQYSQRKIASLQKDEKRQSLVFWEVFIMKFIVSFVMLIIYGVFLLFIINSDYFILFIIFTIELASILFDISYFYQGNEKFGIMVFRNSVVKITVVILIFVFVKTKNDLNVYAFLNVLAIFISTISLWIAAPRYLKKINRRELNIFQHFLPALKLFIPALTLTLYVTINKTLIGILVPGTSIVNGIEVRNANIQNGLFEQAFKVYKLCVLFLTSLGTVMIPRNTRELSEGKIENFNKNINKAIRFTMLFGFPIVFGLIATAYNFSGWFYGPGFDGIEIVIILLAPRALFQGLNNIFGMQYMIPKQLDRQYSIFVLIGGAINIIFSIPLIIMFGAVGAAISSTLSEFIRMVAMIVYLKNKEQLQFTVPLKYLLSGLIMFSGVFALNYFLKSSIPNTLIIVSVGVISYTAMMLITKDELFREILNFMFSGFKKIFKKN